MIYRSQSRYSRLPGGFLRFRVPGRGAVHGYGEGDYIRMRDEFGNVWIGSATRDDDNIIRFRFRDPKGHYATGMSDSYGVLLRDDSGNTWRGFLD